MSYDAFISYSHEADARLAPAIRDGLQSLARPWNKRQALRVFLDESGLAINEDLWKSVHSRLLDSRFLVLLASPAAAASPWVNREIEAFLSRSDSAHVLPVVTAGTWGWDATNGDFAAESTAVPDALRGVFDTEPRHLALGWWPEVSELELGNMRFRDAIADIAAPIHGIDKDELESQAIREHRRFRRIRNAAVAALAVLAVAAVVFGIAALLNAREANRQTEIAEQRQAEAEASAAEALRQRDLALASKLVSDARIEMAAGRSDVAILLGAEAVRLEGGARASGGVTEATKALLTVLTEWPQLAVHLHGHDAPVSAAAIRFDAAQVASGDRTGVLRLWDVAAAAEVARGQVQQIPSSMAISADGRFVAAAGTESLDAYLEVWDTTSGVVTEVTALRRGPDQGYGPLALSDDGSLLAATLAWEDGTVGDVVLIDWAADTVLWSTFPGSELPFVDFRSLRMEPQRVVAVADDSQFAFDLFDGSWTEEDRPIGPLTGSLTLPGDIGDQVLVDDERWAVGWTESAVVVGTTATDIVSGALARTAEGSLTTIEGGAQPVLVRGTERISLEAVTVEGSRLEFDNLNGVHAVSEDGSLLAASTLDDTNRAGYVVLWDLASGDVLAGPLALSLPGPEVYDLQDQQYAQLPGALRFSPDGSLLVGGLYLNAEGSYGRQIVGWRVPAMDEQFRHDAFAWGVSFSRSGDQIAYAGEDGIHLGPLVDLYEAPLPKLDPVGPQFADDKDDVGLSGDGSLIVASKDRASIELWDVPSGRLLLDFPASGVPSFVVAEGTTFVRWEGRDGAFELPLDAASWLDAACSLAGRTLTEEEWLTFLGVDIAYAPSCAGVEPSLLAAAPTPGSVAPAPTTSLAAVPATTAAPTTAVATTTTSTVVVAAPLPEGLLCRDLADLDWTLWHALAYWVREGLPERMDADGNGIPCETVYPEADFGVVLFFDAGLLGSGLFCADVLDAEYNFWGALAYWVREGTPERMDADGNGIPCETVYSAEEIDFVLNFELNTS